MVVLVAAEEVVVLEEGKVVGLKSYRKVVVACNDSSSRSTVVKIIISF